MIALFDKQYTNSEKCQHLRIYVLFRKSLFTKTVQVYYTRMRQFISIFRSYGCTLYDWSYIEDVQNKGGDFHRLYPFSIKAFVVEKGSLSQNCFSKKAENNEV